MSTSDKTSPNILFLFPDQWRWDWVGCEGVVPVRTPNIDRLVERGMRFTQCRSNSPLCGPARSCLAQGVRYHRNGVRANNFDMDRTRPTYFKDLRASGYHVTTCGKNDLHKASKWGGRDGWVRQLGELGFTRAIEQLDKRTAARVGGLDKGGPMCPYTSLLHSEGMFDVFRDDHLRRLNEASLETATWPSPLPRRLYSDDFCGRSALKLLDELPQEGPWFLWVNFPGPHDPEDPPRELQARYDGVDFPMPVNPPSSYRNDPAVNHQQVRRNYAASIEGIDEWVGWIIDRVEQRGELDNTIIMLCSDHGEMLGDHGRFTKGRPYEGSVHVPLIIAGPGVVEGGVSHAPVELIDIAATTLDLAGLEVPEHYDARSLVPVLTGKQPDHSHRDVQVAQIMGWRMICDGRYKLITDEGDPDGTTAQLYDLSVDPYETNNIAAAEAERVAVMLKRMTAEVGAEAPF